MISAYRHPAGKAVVEVAVTVSPEVKAAAVQVVLSDGEVEVNEILSGRIGETLALAQRLLASVGIIDIRGPLLGAQEGDEVAVDDKLPSEQVEMIDARLISLVVDPVNALSEAQRTVKGKVRSGEEIARAIPDVEAFLDAVSRRKDGKFFELNEAGQLVIEDGCPEAYGLGDDFPTAKMRQSCIWYLDEQGVTQSLQGEELYTVKEVDGKEFGVRGKVQVLELTDAAKKVVPTMASGLPTLKWWDDEERHKGEYDDSLGCLRARIASWVVNYGCVSSNVFRSYYQCDYLGSRGVLRVNLNLKS
ncbi:MAG: hypothetical protein UT55_C0047G0002 [Candidatus Peregrinibacteria bacterium GW2011_GWE2_39_6]|nr:MAG: hypothetical protein UT55_C0047G0002 [Candidatus Peregrinibacteria bacterium GW2011_GWE2_39_6]